MKDARCGIGWLCLGVMLAGAALASGEVQAQELVRNPQFHGQSGQLLPEGWSGWKPQWEQAACLVRGTEAGCWWRQAATRIMRLAAPCRKFAGFRPGRRIGFEAVCELRQDRVTVSVGDCQARRGSKQASPIMSPAYWCGGRWWKGGRHDSRMRSSRLKG